MKQTLYLLSIIALATMCISFDAMSQAISKEVHQQIEDDTPYESISLYKDTNGLVSIYWGKSNVSIKSLAFHIKAWETGTGLATDTSRLECTVYQLDEFPFIPLKQKRFHFQPGKQYMVEVMYHIRRELPDNKASIELKKVKKVITA